MNKIILLFFGMFFAALVFSEAVTDETKFISAVKIENESYYTPYPAEPGQYVNVWIRVRQSGGIAATEDIVCKVEPKFPFALDIGESAEKNVGTLATGELVLLKYRLQISPNAVEGNNEIDFKCKANGESKWSSVTLKIYIQTHDPVIAITDVAAEPKTVLPGEKYKVTLTVKNLADSPLKDISVSLNMSNASLPFAPADDINEKRLKQLASGESAEIQFNMRASPSASVDVYKIPVSMSYSDTLGNDYTKNAYISMVVDAKPRLFFALESTTLTKKGTKGRVSVTIANRGLSKIQFVTVKLLNKPDYVILSSDEKYVGNLNPDDSTSADFDLFTNTTKMSPSLPFEISYVDEFGRSHSENKSISIPLYTQEEAIAMGLEKKQENGPWFMVGGGVVVLLVLWQVLKFLRKK